MSAPPYMKLYWGDYSRKTRHLTRAVEHGAYLMLIGALWDAEGKLPADDETLALHALLTAEEWAAMKPKIMPFFKVRRGLLTQDRVTEELAKYKSTSGKRKEAGKAGGKASVGKRTENPEAIASVLPTQSKSESEPKKEYSEGKPSADLLDFADPGKLAWDMAIKLLTERGGMKEPQARGFFGKQLRDNNIEARDLLAPISAAVANGTGDPQGYLTRAAKAVTSRKTQPAKRVGFV